MGESRLPHNLQGLLRFCMQVGDNPQTSPEATVASMDPERAQWLREAMNSMTVDIGKQLRDNIAKLLQSAEDGGSEDVEACLECLKDTADLCDHMDIANDFVKLGGLEVAAYVCRRGNVKLRAAALHLMARLFQNNPFAQAAGVSCVAELVAGVRGEGDIEGEVEGEGDVRFAALSALSCLVRDCAAAQEACVAAGGFVAIAGCLSRYGEGETRRQSQKRLRLRRKAAFLLASLAGESATLADRLASDADGVGEALALGVLEEAALDEDEDSATSSLDCDWLQHALGCLLRLLCRGSQPEGEGEKVDTVLRRRLLAVDGFAAGLESLRVRLQHREANGDERFPEAVQLADRLDRVLQVSQMEAAPIDR